MLEWFCYYLLINNNNSGKYFITQWMNDTMAIGIVRIRRKYVSKVENE